MRLPAIVRWPGTVPAGVVTEESLTAQDWYQTFAALAGASDKVPTGRPLDGIDASQFLLGTSEHTGRETVVFFGPDGSLMSVKWNNVKVWLRYTEGVDKPIVQPQFPLVFDLGSDPGENYNLFSDKTDMGWMIGIALRAVGEYQQSIAQYPNIKPGEDFTGY
jgi:arylsulfatase